MNFSIYELYLEFMNKGLSFGSKTGLSLPINEIEFHSFLSIINFIRDQFKAISTALAISFRFFKENFLINKILDFHAH